MTLAQFTDDFVRRYTGKSIGFPGNSFRGECLSLTKQFIKEFYKIDPPPSGCNGARCYWSVFPHPLGTVLKKVPNTPELVPQKGWIAVWNGRTGRGYGHIGTVIDANINTFRSFDQNWGSRNAQIVTHDYKNLYGFLVPIKEEEPPMSGYDPAWIEEQLMHLKNERERTGRLRAQVDTLKDENKRLSEEINDILSRPPVIKEVIKEIKVEVPVKVVKEVPVEVIRKVKVPATWLRARDHISLALRKILEGKW